MDYEDLLLQDINSKGWHSLVKYALDIPEGEETHGYRIFYKATNGKLYSAYHPTPEYTERHLDELTPFKEGELHHDTTEHGYYYWANKEVADAYLKVTHKKHPLSRGNYVLREVSGIAMKKGRDEGDLMNDMIIKAYDPKTDGPEKLP